MALTDYIHAMPKVELHLHLEGSIRPEMLLELARRNEVKLPVSDIAGIREWYRFRDFNHFIQVYVAICSTLRKPEDFSLITCDLGEMLARQNVRYAEITWTPGTHVRKDLPFEAILRGVNAGRERVERSCGVQMRWIPDIARSMLFPEPDQIADWVSSPEARAGGVVAFGLGGPEVGYPPELYESAFAIARRNGLPGNPHAGEVVGPESVWGAIRSLQATRIGHGVRAIEDRALVAYLVENQIPLEVNPTSNLCLGVFPSYAQHSLKQLADAGVIVTISSDDPPMFNTTLNDEYVHAVQDCGLTLPQLEKAALDAVRVSYLPPERKAQMLNEFKADYRRLRREHGIVDDERYLETEA
jgi:adenosine deaminase